MTNISMREINYVLTVHNAGSITKAAQVLYIAQPSLSQSIQKIESTLGIQLFSRAGNRMKLTYAGELFVESGLKILQIFRNLENNFKDISNLDAGRIVLGIPFYLGSYMFPCISNIYRLKHPHVKINPIEGSSTQLEEMILNGTVDIAIMPVLKNIAFPQKPIFTSKILLSLPLKHWLNEHLYYKPGEAFPYVDIRLASNEPFIVGQPGQRIRQMTEIVFQKAGIDPPIVFESKSIETIKRMSAAGIGLAFMPEYYHNFFMPPWNATYCYIEDEYSSAWTVSMVYQCEDDLSTTIREFMNIVEETFGGLRPTAFAQVAENSLRNPL